LPLLEKYVNDPVPEVAETCQIAVDRIKWVMEQKDRPASNYLSVDPAPPHPSKSIQELRKNYLDTNLSMFHRYRALFALREIGTAEAVEVMCEGLWDKSALFRHEVAYVLGQVQHPAAAPHLTKVLELKSENPMVRHEAAEALGALITTESMIPLLERFTKDSDDIVRESCEVATDIQEYYKTEEFQYADGLEK
jgi:deoxyhypusine monooxygenase